MIASVPTPAAGSVSRAARTGVGGPALGRRRRARRAPPGNEQGVELGFGAGPRHPVGEVGGGDVDGGGRHERAEEGEHRPAGAARRRGGGAGTRPSPRCRWACRAAPQPGTWSSRFFSTPVSEPRYTGVASTTASADAMASTVAAVSSPSSARSSPSAGPIRSVPRSRVPTARPGRVGRARRRLAERAVQAPARCRAADDHDEGRHALTLPSARAGRRRRRGSRSR